MQKITSYCKEKKQYRKTKRFHTQEGKLNLNIKTSRIG